MVKGGTMRIIVLLVLVAAHTASAGFEQKEAGARSIALGGAYVALANDIWAMTYNVGGLSRLTTNEASFSYSPQPFGLSEVSFAAAGVAVPLSIGVVGLSASRYGFELYRELAGGISYARRIGEIGFGVTLSYYAVAIYDYGS